jgi:hypothetical protein
MIAYKKTYYGSYLTNVQPIEVPDNFDFEDVKATNINGSEVIVAEYNLTDWQKHLMDLNQPYERR